MSKMKVSIPSTIPPPEGAGTPVQSLQVLNILKSEKFARRLNQIDEIRKEGVGNHISLPQLVVCGDQSAGKSSVLEGLTGIPFPKKDGLCTRFATEISIRHDLKQNHITASLVPSADRTDEEKKEFANLKFDLVSFNELPNIIEKVSEKFGVRGHVDRHNAPAFVSDVLRLEVIGNTGLHLTVVDLPGLISVSNNSEDVKLVQKIVNLYMQNPRTIILAVVQASNDIDTQAVIQRARRWDEDGERTVGIITKPDLINEGTESRIALLSNNKDRTKLKLGFFLLKNPPPKELQTVMTPEQREKLEDQFFSQPPWKDQNLNRERIGISKLRAFCQDQLEKHIERELPKVTEEINQMLKENEHKLEQLGEERSSIPELRFYLSQVYQHFNSLTQDASDGKYNGKNFEFFQLQKQNKTALLRAEIHDLNEKFASTMQNRGEKRYLKQDNAFNFRPQNDVYSPQVIFVTKEEFAKWVKDIYRKTRGHELPGTINPDLLWGLYCEQSERWESIADSHLHAVIAMISKFADHALSYVVKDERVHQSLQPIMKEQLEANETAARAELTQLLMDEKGRPITYNHYYLDHVQQARKNCLHDALKTSWDESFDQEESKIHSDQLTWHLQNKIVVNMDDYTCEETANALSSYYQVAMKTFVDNMCRQVIERHVLKGLAKVLNPALVSKYNDDKLREVADEAPEIRQSRDALQKLQSSLKESLRKLRI